MCIAQKPNISNSIEQSIFWQTVDSMFVYNNFANRKDIPLYKTEINLNQLVKSISDQIEIIFGEAVTFNQDIDPKIKKMGIISDELKFTSIFMNII